MVTVRDILNYEGDVLDTKLNYPILALSIVTQVAVLHYLPSEYFPTLKKLLWVPILAFLMAFQIGLCLVVMCSGISIVWSALDASALYLAYYFIQRGYYDRFHQRIVVLLLGVSWLYSIALWIYYVFTADIITSIAHALAVLLGLVLAVVLRYLDTFELTSEKGERRPLITRHSHNSPLLYLPAEDKGGVKSKGGGGVGILQSPSKGATNAIATSATTSTLRPQTSPKIVYRDNVYAGEQ